MFDRRMLENPASEHISSISQRIYQDLPNAKILESVPKTRSAFVTSTETATAVLTNIAKIGALVSLPVEIILLNSYLRDEGAPLPMADTSISILLSLVCVIFLFITLVLTSTFLSPALTKISNPAKPEALTDSFRLKKKRSTAWQKIWQTVREYYLRFGPYLCFILFIFLTIGWFGNQKLKWMGLIAGTVSLLIYGWICYRTHQHKKLGDVLQSSLHSISSFMILLLIVLAVIQQVNPHMNLWRASSFCVGVPLVIHVLTVRWVINWKTALALYVMIVVFLSIMWPGLGVLGGSSLRYMGIGGNIPVSIRVKTYGRTGAVSGVDEITGCLILMTGSDVLIRPTQRVLDCKLHPQFMGGQSFATVETYSRIERYMRADVVRVSKFLESCGTVDGLPTC